MADEQGYYVVGKHGAPTAETAPYGVAWRVKGGAVWLYGDGPYEWRDENQWAPLPAPPTTEAPKPEPVARWTAGITSVAGWVAYRVQTSPGASEDEAQAAADALNALDRDGVVYGPGRPMSKLPPKGAVLCKLNGDWCVAHVNVARYHKARIDCWWPLPGADQ